VQVQRRHVVVLALCGLTGCGSGGRTPEINTGLSAIGAGRSGPSAPLPPPPDPKTGSQAPADIESIVRQAAIDTQKALDELNAANRRPEPDVPAPAFPSPAKASLDAQPPDGPLVGAGAAPEPIPATPADARIESAPAAAQAVEPAPSVVPLPDQVNSATAALIELLRRQATESQNPLKPLLALAALEVLHPGASPTSEPRPPTEGQQVVVDALRELATGLASAATSDDPALDAADRVEAMADRLARRQPLRIVSAVLCERVTGFGSYTAFRANRFPAGRQHRTIVYVEVDRMAHRELGPGDERLRREPGDRYAVEVSEEINLYNESGSLLALRRPEQRVIESSRNRRRDFYLVNEITLPASLSIGTYHLKVTMRDKVSGAVAEAVIPVEVVAESALAGPGGSR
jgi:hypothetical protein